jgi:tetratricopeptide (TPR) repeat protein
VARAISDVALSSEARIAIAQAHVHAGRWEPVADLLLPDLALLLSDAERLERRGQAATRSLMSLTHLALARALAGHDAHARQCVAQAEQVANDTGRPLDRVHLLWTTGTIDRLSGHHDDAVTRFDAGQALAREHELTWWAIQLGPALAAALAAAGRHDDAADAVRRTLAPAMEIGFPMTQTRALVHTAEVEVALGLPEQARVHAQEALRVSEGFDHPLYEAYALRWLAAALVQLDQPEQAGRELVRALRLAGALRIERLAAALREDLDRLAVAGRGGRQPTAG